MALAAITTACMFVGCAADGNEEAANPDYNPETKAVKTEFALNLGHTGTDTRMASAETQQGSPFLGMSEAYLYAFHTGAYGTAPTSTTAPLTNGQYSLGGITGLSTSQTSKVYTLYIPTTTDRFLFYGRATKGSKADNVAGKLTASGLNTSITKPSDISFTLNGILSTSGKTDANTTAQTALIGYLDLILQAKVTTDETAVYTTATLNTTWKGTQYTAAHGSAQEKLDYQAISDAYQKFVSMGSLGVRQGSSFAITRMCQDLYRAMDAIKENTTAPATVRAVAAAVEREILKSFNISSGSKQTTVLALKANSTYPASVNLPEGAATIASSVTAVAADDVVFVDGTTVWDSFAYQNTGKNVFAGASPDISTNITKIDYPSELMYYCSSPVVTSDDVHEANDFAKTVDNWNAVTSTKDGWTGTWAANSEVSTSTHAVAMQNNVTYGTAMLVSTVVINNGAGTYVLEDNANAVTGGKIANQDITFDGNDFIWKGILIGGQPDGLDYQFLPSSASMTQVIYDNQIQYTSSTNHYITTTASNPTYTLVCDNKHFGAGSEENVTVALEIENNSGKDFYGKDGVIAAGQTFYLLAQLNPGSPDGGTGNIATNAPIGYPVSTADRVFAQDFKTFVNFTIGANSLKAAYTTIPDLRSTQMVFGLSVDLTWKSGLTFNKTF